MGGNLQEKLKRVSRKGNQEKNVSVHTKAGEKEQKELYLWGMEGTLNPDVICATFK